MSLPSSSYIPEKSPINDGFELDRLADQLAQREQDHVLTNGANPHGANSPAQDLPVPLALSHDNPYLSTETFSVDEFLLSRTYTSLYDLRTELREYYATLKEELVQLINDDYEAFLSLSTDLRGEGARLERMKWPLGDMKAVITMSRAELQELLDAIEEKMKRRAALRDEKAFLHLLLKVSDSVARLETLLLIAAPEKNRFDAAVSPNATTIHDEPGDDRNMHNNRPKHLLRIATEFTQLQYHADKAKPSKFVDEMQWRIDRIKSTLTSDLENLFSKTLLTVTSVEQTPSERPKLADGDKAKSMSELMDCLKAYDMLGLWRDAEDVIRKDVVRSFIKKNVYAGSLSGPHSPVLPHTPLPQVRTLDSTQPKTPFTPYTAFPSRQNYFGESAASVYLLDDADDPLASLYNKILRFVDRDLKQIMEAAELLRKRSQTKPTTDMRAVATQNSSAVITPSEEDKEKGFNLFVNVVWEEVARAIMDELGSLVFAAGKPDEFRRNYETTQAFLRSLEYLAPSMSAIRKMRSSPRFESFSRRWQLPVYFQLRWKDVVTKVEDAIESTPSLTSISRRTDTSISPFKLTPTAAVWQAMCQCWSDNVYLPDLGHKFWRLTLQLLSRYHVWLKGCLQSLDALATGKSNVDRLAPTSATPSSRSGTPLADAQHLATEVLVLEQSAVVLSDIKELEQKCTELWRHSIRDLLPPPAVNNENTFEETFMLSVRNLTELSPSVISHIVVILTRRCCEALAPVKSLPGQFRATSQKHMPTKTSSFVPLILRPLKMFFGLGVGDGPGKSIQKWYGSEIGTEVVEAVSSRYVAHVTYMKKAEESLRRLKVGKKTGFSFFGGGSSSDDDARDEERIRRQLILDVDAFEKDAALLDIDVRSIQSFQTLSATVNEVPHIDSSASTV